MKYLSFKNKLLILLFGFFVSESKCTENIIDIDKAQLQSLGKKFEESINDPADERKLSQFLVEENKNLHKIVSEQAKEIETLEENKNFYKEKIIEIYLLNLDARKEQRKQELEEKQRGIENVERLRLIEAENEDRDFQRRVSEWEQTGTETVKRTEQEATVMLERDRQEIEEAERLARAEIERLEREKANQPKIARETARVVTQTHNEVKRFIRKF